jgi:hypothetical protein
VAILAQKFIMYNKAKANAYCLENRLTHHDLCDEHHERRVEDFAQDMLETEDTAPSEIIRSYYLKIMYLREIKKAYVIDGIPNECLRQFPRPTLVHLTHLFNH